MPRAFSRRGGVEPRPHDPPPPGGGCECRVTNARGRTSPLMLLPASAPHSAGWQTRTALSAAAYSCPDPDTEPSSPNCRFTDRNGCFHLRADRRLPLVVPVPLHSPGPTSRAALASSPHHHSISLSACSAASPHRDTPRPPTPTAHPHAGSSGASVMPRRRPGAAHQPSCSSSISVPQPVSRP